MAPVVMACMATVSCTCREKVMKVFNMSMQMLNLMISSSKIESSPEAMSIFRFQLTDENIVPRLLLKSEESNTRVTNKIHETLLDLSYHAKIGEDLVSKAILVRIEMIYSSGSGKSNHKGLLAQLALLYKMINSFGIQFDATSADDAASTSTSSLTVVDVLAPAMISVEHSNTDVRNAATKIVLDVQRLTGKVKDHHLASLQDKKVRDALKEKITNVQVQIEMNQSANKKVAQESGSAASAVIVTEPDQPMSDEQKALAVLLASEDEDEKAKANSSFGAPRSSNAAAAGQNDSVEVRDKFYQNKTIVIEKGEHKEWQ